MTEPNRSPYFAVHHVLLSCPPDSESASREFYVEVLGLAELTKPPRLAARGGCWFRGPRPDGGVEFHLGVEPDFRPSPKAHPGVVWGDLARLRELADRLLAAGHPADWDDELHGVPMFRAGANPLPDHPHGMHRFYTMDPHGNRLEFMAPQVP